MKLSIVIPAYNEELRLGKALTEYGTFFGKLYGEQAELIVVANHCSDATVEVAETAAQEYPQIRVVVEPAKIGKGGAVAIGFREATGELIGFVDADSSTPPAVFEALVQQIGSAGVVVGSRWIDGAVVDPRQSWMRRLASRILNKLFVQFLFGLDVKDSQCGAKLYRRAVIDKILPELTELGWAFDIEMLCRAKRLGYAIKEIPIEWHHVPGNPTTFAVMSLQMMASVIRVKRALKRGE